VICENDSKAYISRNGGKREPLSGSISMLLTPSGTSYYHSSIVSVYGISNFANTFYRRDDGDIIRINGRYETDSIAKEVYEVYLAQDGNTLTYSRNENIYKVNGKKSKDDATQIVDGDVFTFLATIDGRAVYYINEDGEIFYQKGTGKSVSVTNDVTGFDFTLFKGKTFYYVSDDELYVSSGGKGKRVDGFNGEVKGVSGGMHTLSVTADDDGEILFYRSTDGKKFEILRQED
jgi:hypothetical protein